VVVVVVVLVLVLLVVVLVLVIISNIKIYRVGESEKNTLLRCKVSPGR